MYGSEAMVKVRNYGSLNIQNGTVSNLNVNAFGYDSSEYSYVGQNGGVFSFYSVASSSDSVLTYTITNVTFNNLYGYEGAAIYFKTIIGVTTAMDNHITLSGSCAAFGCSYRMWTEIWDDVISDSVFRRSNSVFAS